jgi:phage tail tape-measure protein
LRALRYPLPPDAGSAGGQAAGALAGWRLQATQIVPTTAIGAAVGGMVYRWLDDGKT